MAIPEIHALGRYEIVREIGRGNAGTVYLGHDPFSGADVAIKVAHPEAVGDEKAARRRRKLFFNEARAAGILRHPHIVAVRDAGVEGDIRYIVMEYVDGGRTLHTYCSADNLLPMENALEIVLQCASALGYAHSKGVVHRDVKPRNILLTRDLQVKVADFGIALITRPDVDETQVHGYLGSPIYMSPEQLDEETITEQSDIFSLGVVLYEMLTGHHPFAGTSLAKMTRNIRQNPPTPLRKRRPNAPDILEQIIERALKKHPAGRYQTALDLAGDLSLVFDELRINLDVGPIEDRQALVQDLTFFNGFEESWIRELVDAGIWEEFRTGASVFEEGDVGNSFYVLVSGAAVVRKGQVQVVEIPPGDSFGEIGFVTRALRTESVFATKPVTAIRLRASSLQRLSADCRQRVQETLLRNLSNKLILTTEKFSSNRRRTINWYELMGR